MNPKLDMLFARRSIRTYEEGPVADSVVRDLLEAGMAAPSAVAKDPWRFVVVKNREMLVRISDGLPNGKMIASAGLGFVVCGDLDAAHDRKLSYLLQDCSAAIQNVLVAASALGLGACWLGIHPREERIEHVRRLLQLPENIMPVSAIAFGRPAEKKEPRTRYDESKVHAETW